MNNEGKRIISNTNGLTQSDNGSLITNKSSSQNGYLSTDSGHINSEMVRKGLLITFCFVSKIRSIEHL